MTTAHSSAASTVGSSHRGARFTDQSLCSPRHRAAGGRTAIAWEHRVRPCPSEAHPATRPESSGRMAV